MCWEAHDGGRALFACLTCTYFKHLSHDGIAAREPPARGELRSDADLVDT
jgi:hypothetical protein